MQSGEDAPPRATIGEEPSWIVGTLMNRKRSPGACLPREHHQFFTTRALRFVADKHERRPMNTAEKIAREEEGIGRRTAKIARIDAREAAVSADIN